MGGVSISSELLALGVGSKLQLPPIRQVSPWAGLEPFMFMGMAGVMGLPIWLYLTTR